MIFKYVLSFEQTPILRSCLTENKNRLANLATQQKSAGDRPNPIFSTGSVLKKFACLPALLKSGPGTPTSGLREGQIRLQGDGS